MVFLIPLGIVLYRVLVADILNVYVYLSFLYWAVGYYTDCSKEFMLFMIQAPEEFIFTASYLCCL